MNRIAGQTFTGERDQPWPWQGARSFEDLEILNCQFEGCSLSVTLSVCQRAQLRRVLLRDISVRGCAIGPSIIEEVDVENLKTWNMLLVSGAALRHDTLRGRIGELMITQYIATATASQQAAFNTASTEYYSSVDWALDIRSAEFTKEPDLRGIPGELIRRDPTTQALISVDKAAEALERQVGLKGTDLESELQALVTVCRNKYYVWAAPRASRSFSEVMGYLRRLQDLGIAELE